ncbi:hypothetical protein [uncultured Sphingomonas sp.]|uniref:hypothetical protein n=1 Tax=uncultured Sphingomonas sp. TaxID=158754 RepID=UPI0025E87BD3|nr:hypothetical protein [uncultured Sphingomonas sp.]
MRHFIVPICAALVVAAAPAPAPAHAATPREILTQASFGTTDKAQALTLVKQALAQADAELKADPGDREAVLQHGVALGYRARLTRSPADAKAARALFETYAATSPRDPEGQLALATWHLDTVEAGFFAFTMLKAKKEVGLAALNRAVALGGNRAFFPGFAALLRIRLNPKDVAGARQLAERALAGSTNSALDRLARRDAEAVLVPLRNNDGAAAAQLARKLLPFGRLD